MAIVAILMQSYPTSKNKLKILAAMSDKVYNYIEDYRNANKPINKTDAVIAL